MATMALRSRPSNSLLAPGPPGSVGRDFSTGNLCFESASVALRPRIRVVGYAGDYSSYITTYQEYGRQSYEAASTLLGRNTAKHIEALLVAIADLPAPHPEGGVAVFDTML